MTLMSWPTSLRSLFSGPLINCSVSKTTVSNSENGAAVRVADPLALDDFRALLFDRCVDEFLDVDISRHGKPPTAVRRGCGGAYMAFVACLQDVGGTGPNTGGLP